MAYRYIYDWILRSIFITFPYSLHCLWFHYKPSEYSLLIIVTISAIITILFALGEIYEGVKNAKTD